jgi:hypothetical protein
MKPMEDAMAMLGAVMPADAAVRAYRYLDDTARTERRAGDQRHLDQMRCDAFAEALSESADGPGAVAADPDGSVAVGLEESHPQRSRSVAQETSPAATSVQVVISLTSLLGLDSRSAHLDGYGSISAGAARAMIASGDFSLRRLLCNPDTGAVVHADSSSYAPSVWLRHAVGCRDRSCRMPVCGARIQHLDHIQARADAGLTTTDNLEGVCVRSHLAKHHPGWRVHGDGNDVVTWTTPTGHEYASLPPPATGYGTGPPDELDSRSLSPGWFSRDQRSARAMQSWLQNRRSA